MVAAVALKPFDRRAHASKGRSQRRDLRAELFKLAPQEHQHDRSSAAAREHRGNQGVTTLRLDTSGQTRLSNRRTRQQRSRKRGKT